MTRTKYQKFEIVEIPRSSIQNAPYNPRKINDKAKSKLKKNLKTKGLLQPLVWNEKTGNLVSGHQRISIIDELEKSEDYHLQVAKVSLTDKEEKEQNLFFNNINAMGEWDLFELEDLFREGELDYLEAGFDLSDLNALDIELFSNDSLDDDEQNILEPPPKLDIPKFAHLTDEERKEKVKDMKQNILDESNNRNQTKQMFTIVFDNLEQFEQFIDDTGLNGTFCTYSTFSKLLKH